MPIPPNVFSGRYVDRSSLLRKDVARLKGALIDPDTRFLPVWRSRNLIAIEGDRRGALLVERHRLEAYLRDESTVILLGRFRQSSCFAVEIDTEQPPSFGERGEFQDLRLIGGLLPGDEAGLLAYARAMVLWHQRHRFCGSCGAPTQPTSAGHVLACSNGSCGAEQFPRIDPAVIVLVTDGERALLGRQASWPPGRYSTIAGFVEPGESLEDAVVREVLEETGIRSTDIEYHSSQPWPFPSSLMIGFTARAASTVVGLNDDELEDARWFSRAEIAHGQPALPPPQSISFRLIEDWYNAGSSRPLREEPGARLWEPPR